MKLKAFKKILYLIREAGHGDKIVYMCDNDDDDFSINYWEFDNDWDIRLVSSDLRGSNKHEYTANELLDEFKDFCNEDYIYFREEYYGEWGSIEQDDFDIEFNWYIGWDDWGNRILNIDCHPTNWNSL